MSIFVAVYRCFWLPKNLTAHRLVRSSWCGFLQPTDTLHAAAAAQNLEKFGRSPNKGSVSMASPAKSPQVPSRAEEPHAAAGSEDEDEAGGGNAECSHAACSAKVTPCTLR